MNRKFGRPTPALIVAMVALFVALTGSAVAVAIVPRAKLANRALVANNALKLGGKTAAQVVASVDIPEPTPPLTSIASFTSVKTANFTLNAGAEQNVTATCDPGGKAMGGGFNNPTQALVFELGSGPTADGGGWVEDLANVSSSTAASGTVIVTCVK